MPRLRYVEVYPYSGHLGRPWARDDADDDTFAKVVRGICDSYSSSLTDADLDHAVSSIRIFLGDEHIGRHRPDLVGQPGASVVAPLYTGRPEGFEQAAVRVPRGFAGWRLDRQRAVALDLVHEAAVGVASFRGLDLRPFAQARAEVVAGGYTFRWSSAWKAAPGRRLRARCVFRSDVDGFGRMAVEVSDASGSVSGRSPEQIAGTTAEGFRRAAKTLRWESPTRLTFLSYVGIAGAVGDPFSAEVMQTPDALEVRGTTPRSHQPTLPEHRRASAVSNGHRNDQSECSSA